MTNGSAGGGVGLGGFGDEMGEGEKVWWFWEELAAVEDCRVEERSGGPGILVFAPKPRAMPPPGPMEALGSSIERPRRSSVREEVVVVAGAEVELEGMGSLMSPKRSIRESSTAPGGLAVPAVTASTVGTAEAPAMSPFLTSL